MPELFAATTRGEADIHYVLTSPDGISWSVVEVLPPDGDNPTTRWWDSIAHGDGRFVAVSIGTALVSTDGVTWTPHAMDGSLASTYPSSLAYGAGLFVAVGNGVVQTSPDGVTWTTRSLPSGANTKFWRAVTYGGGQFVAVADNVSMISADGITWTVSAPLAFATGVYRGLAYGAGRYVAVNTQPYSPAVTWRSIVWSADGLTWTAVPVGVPGGPIAVGQRLGLHFSSPDFVAVGQAATQTLMVSLDGVSWFGAGMNPAVAELWDVTQGADMWVAVGLNTSGHVALIRSPFASAWTYQTLTGIPPAVSVTFGEVGTPPAPSAGGVFLGLGV